jgi:torulene dioxygenase
MSLEQKPKGYRWDIITEEELKYAPPYFQDVPETTTEVECKLSGTWPKWIHGSFLRYVTETNLPARLKANID